MRTESYGSATWNTSPAEQDCIGSAAVLHEHELHDLATNDVFWDKIVEISSVGNTTYTTEL